MNKAELAAPVLCDPARLAGRSMALLGARTCLVAMLAHFFRGVATRIRECTEKAQIGQFISSPRRHSQPALPKQVQKSVSNS